MLQITAPENEHRILLHSCCAPCSSAIIECLIDNNIKPVMLFFNPNIYPSAEYETRKEEAKRFATLKNIDFIDADYNYNAWKEEMKGLEDEPERGNRCLKCFYYRLSYTAKYAKEHGLKVFTTYLASSRCKILEQINKACRLAASQYEVTMFCEHNWRKGGLQELRNQLLKENNFYNQRYCGCEFSLKATSNNK